jgi:hypothetical protein
MADNVSITPGSGATVAADDIGGVLHQRVKVGVGADGTAVDWEGVVYGVISRPSANFTRPANTTAYALGDLVANSVTNTSVTAMSFTVARVAAGSGMIRRCRIRKSGTSTSSAVFRLHLYNTTPSTITNGDNGVFSTSGVDTYLGAFDVNVDRAFTDGAAGNGVPITGNEINFKLASGTTVVGFLEARAAYTPASAEVFTVDLEVIQN